MTEDLQDIPRTEQGWAEAFIGQRLDSLRYVSDLGQWRIFDGRGWKTDQTGVVLHKIAKELTREEFHHEKLGRASTAAAVERLARIDPRITTTSAQWDCDKWLLGTPDGVVDLSTGEKRPARPGDLMVRQTAAVPRAGAPLWERFLETITRGDLELQGYLQRVAGYCLTGDVSEEVLFFGSGDRQSGKSTFISALQHAMGSYARTMEDSVVLDSGRGHSPHPTDVAGLMGTRLAVIAETEPDRRWNERRVKQLTGGDVITARLMRQDFVDFLPTFKLFVAGNNKPALSMADGAMQRRLHVIPFEHTIPQEERDLRLKEKLKAEAGGILQWAIEGCLAWQRGGLRPAQAVAHACAEYFWDEDVLGRWLAVCTETGPELSHPTGEAYESFCEFCAANNEHQIAMRQFAPRLAMRGFGRRKGTGGVRLITGLRVLKAGETPKRLKLVQPQVEVPDA